MTDRSREEISPASEEYSHYHLPGSFLFSQPAEVDHWCQSVPSGVVLPLTPPDSASDCTFSDYQDMSGHDWSQVSLPESSWISGPGPDHGTLVQLTGSEWQGQSFTQEPATLNASAWLDMPSSAVDLGLSPVLSQESQSSRTLHSFSEPDPIVLPLNLDLLSTETKCNHHAGVYHSATDVQSQMSSGDNSAASPVQAFYRSGMEDQTFWQASHSVPRVYQHSDNVLYPLRGPSQPTIVPKRPLLPRMEGPAVPSQPVYGPQRILQPQMPKQQMSQADVSNVSRLPSTAVGVPQQVPVHAQGHIAAPSPLSPQSLPSAHSVGHAAATAPSWNGPFSRPFSTSSCVQDQGSVDFSNFLHLDPEENTTSPTMVRSVMTFPGHDANSIGARDNHVASYVHNPALVSYMPIPETKPVVTGHHDSMDSNQLAASVVTPNMPIDQEEGRHRTHPLYSEGPRTDGLYYCPFATEFNCQHKPTKLKCNYDKFIDSHIKPFRCKVEACAKQEFSSTACLLRHEREAHAMHGHGDRPHLCYYPGCERGIPGNGFPRRYNLFDHMKRVHDHKEELNSSNGSPVLTGESQGPMKAGGRKRKAAGPASEEPLGQRRRPALVQPQPVYGLPQPAMEYISHPGGYQLAMEEQLMPGKTQNRQRSIYSQWANQRQLLARQMDFVQSPDDEDNLQRLSQNIEELRRLSQEARRG